MKKGPVNIYYASQDGIAEGFAKSLALEAKAAKIQATVTNVAAFFPSSLQSQDHFIFIVATHYDGNCPDDADAFWEWIQKPSDKGFLKGRKVTMFGLGDKTYDFFNQFSKDLNDRFIAYGMEL